MGSFRGPPMYVYGDGLGEDESRRFQSNLHSTQYKDKWTQNLASSVRAKILYT